MTDEQIKAAFQDALESRDKGEMDDAMRKLEALLPEEMPSRYRAQILCVLGGLLYYEKKDPDAALPHLREAVALAPRAELASVPLFHVLMAKKQVDEAFGEARRFLALEESAEYRQLFKEWSQAEDVDNEAES